jgi:hypothetical protein
MELLLMTDKEKFMQLLDEVVQPYYFYSQIGEGGNLSVMVVDKNQDGARLVTLFYFNMDTGKYKGTGIRHIDP